MMGVSVMLRTAFCLLGATPAGPDHHAATAVPATGRWTSSQAQTWYRSTAWPVGCNFLPSTAINDVEMWEAETFDPETIARELGWAHSLGMNAVRVFLNYVVWRDDPAGMKARLKQFMETAASRGIRVVPVLFDDCAFAGREPETGPQGDPAPGIHNSGWVPSPGLKQVTDRNAWPDLARYVEDIVGSFGQDERVLFWDLYNEPGNSRMGEKSLPLVEATFDWARSVAPSQPLTVGVWADFHGPMGRRLMNLSDIISFHSYESPAVVDELLRSFDPMGRPVICTEWLHRANGNTVGAILPLFEARRVGCFNWGLVAGRTQTYLPWESRAGDPAPALWQHDLLHADGTAYRDDEVAVFRRVLAAR